jgi:crotonobetainyl-CoA:carnitine CoA-transferase CaiB-like acyl-CoA transferase
LDEVVQMMGGLAYMTGRPGDPLRAGASVNDIMGGMFGAMGAMAALAQRAHTGLGQEVQSALFENNVLLVAQHMLQYQVTGQAAKPMPSRISAWAIYDVFEVQNGEQIFLAVVSDTAWKIFCEVFGYADLLADERLITNNARVAQRDWLISLLRERLRVHSSKHLSDLFEKNSLPYAPITPPHELLDDEHLKTTGGLAPLTLSDGREIQTVLLPMTLNQERLKVRTGVPSLGAHNQDVLSGLGYSPEEIEQLSQANKPSKSPSTFPDKG